MSKRKRRQEDVNTKLSLCHENMNIKNEKEKLIYMAIEAQGRMRS